jgi:hypothetical protein
MNHTPGLLGATVRGTLKGLPWLSILAISASVAYAMTVAAAGVQFAGDAQTTISVAQAPAHPLVTAGAGGSITSTAAVDGAGSDEACDTTGGRLLYIGLNSWIPAEAGAAHCPGGIPSTP